MFEIKKMTESELQVKLQEQYVELAKIVKQHNSKKPKTKELTICPAIQGSKDAEIMIVGRAINGWCPVDADTTEDMVNQLYRCQNIGLNWVVSTEQYYTGCKVQGCPRAKNKTCEKSKRELVKNNPFWGIIKYIQQQNEPSIENKEWTNDIIWTNLFKASYVAGGNPKGLYKKLVDSCSEILKLEIALYRPKYIYFITEKNSNETPISWFAEEYHDRGKPYCAFKSVYEYLKDTYERNQVFILKRPEAKKREIVYEEKIDFFDIKKGE